MRYVATRLVFVVWSCAIACHASAPDAAQEQRLAPFELRAQQASPDARCYAYAQLVERTVEYSAQQYASGNPEQATEMLKRSQGFVARIATRLTRKTRKMKEAEILLRRAVYRLQDVLHAGTVDDRTTVEETLAQIDRARSDVLAQLLQR